MSKYDTDSKQLAYLSEKSNSTDNLIPKTIDYTLSNQLGRSLILATDENGLYYFGVYHLVEGDGDKYVNTVFYDSINQDIILALYYYFCNNQYNATEQLLASVSRVEAVLYETTNLEYNIDGHIIDSLVCNAKSYVINKKIKPYLPNSLLAFITVDNYEDYQIVIEEKFNVKKMFLYEQLDVNSNVVTNYKLATRMIHSAFIPISILLSVVIVGAIGTIVLIIAVIIMLR